MRRRQRHHQRHRGTILIVAMLISFALAGVVLALSRSMRAETIASANEVAAMQADAIERGAEQYLMAMLAQEGEEITSLSEDQFAAVQVGDGHFWVLRPQFDDPDMPVFGLMPESGKVNLNTVGFDEVMLLPGMDYTAASSILDWKDDDNRLERDGAESDYYLALPEGYFCKNAPFETVEELLMVRGVTREMLNGIPGVARPLGERGTMVVRDLMSLGVDPQEERGLFDLLTVRTVEPNTNSSGEARINVNVGRSQRPAMREQLRRRLTERLDKARADQIISRVGDNRMQDVFVMYYRCRLTTDEMDKIADDIGTSGDQTLSGRININFAPRDVLMCLQNITPADADKLIAARPSPQDVRPGELSWVISALGESSAAKSLGQQITTHTYQWSADILAVSGNGRAFKRCRITIDNATGTPQIVYRRDITERGWPMDPAILTSIRNGQLQGAYAMAGGMTR